MNLSCWQPAEPHPMQRSTGTHVFRLPPIQIKASEEELLKERDCVGHLIPGSGIAACEITVDTMLPGEN